MYYDDLPDESKSVANWTLDECSAYISMMWESYGEMRAEAGMGAVSFGMDPYGAMMTIEHPATDPAFNEAQRRLDAARSLRSLVRVIRVDPDSITF